MLTYFSLIAFAVMCAGIPFIKFNYKAAAKKKNPVYSSIKPHLPHLTDEERYKRYSQAYGVMADNAIRSKTILRQIKEAESENEREAFTPEQLNNSVTFDVSLALESSKLLISREHH